MILSGSLLALIKCHEIATLSKIALYARDS